MMACTGIDIVGWIITGTMAGMLLAVGLVWSSLFGRRR